MKCNYCEKEIEDEIIVSTKDIEVDKKDGIYEDGKYFKRIPVVYHQECKSLMETK